MSDPGPPPAFTDPEPSPASDDANARAPGPLFGVWFWLMIILAVTCIAAGAIVGLYGSRLFPFHLEHVRS